MVLLLVLGVMPVVGLPTSVAADDDPYAIVSPLPAAGTLGVAYEHEFAGDAPGALWSVTGGTLPPGLVLDADTGVLSGTPTAPGTFADITVQATWPEPFREIAAGWGHTCGILAADDSVHCWGDNTHGQAQSQTGPYAAIAAGAFHTCGILVAEAVAHCWGATSSGQATSQMGPYAAIAAGWSHTCGILAADDSVHCWGDDTDGQSEDQPGPFTAIAVGGFHTCGILAADGSAQCWGSDDVGQAADQSGPFTVIAAGDRHACGILASDDSVHCWGDNTHGQAQSQAGPFTAIAAGGFHTCGILAADDSAHCWGDDTDGQSADQAGPFTAIAAGDRHTCGILAADDSVHCWGDDDFGQSEDQAPAVVATDTQTFTITVPDPQIISSAPAPGVLGEPYEHAFTADAPAAQWSVTGGTLPAGLTLDPHTGILSGTPTTTGTFAEVTVRAAWPDSYRAIAAGENHSCGILTSDDSVHCWGSNVDGQAEDQPGRYTAISAGAYHTCGTLTADGSVHCWGFNLRGQAEDQAGQYTAMAAGGGHNCGILAGDASVHCWGWDNDGQAADQSGPYTAIAAGDRHTCGILAADASAHCWGFDYYDQDADQTGPYTAIAAGVFHSCGILASDASVHCWGSNTLGQATDQVGPYDEVAAGAVHTCGVRAADASVHCWGSNFYGGAEDQVGPYTTIAGGGRHTCGILASDASVHCWGRNDSGQAEDQTSTMVGVDTQTFALFINSPPVISTVADQAIAEGTSTGPLPFVVADDESLSGELTVSAVSDNQALLPDADLALTGSGSSRAVEATPVAGQTGVALVTLTVADPHGLEASTSFTVVVVSAAGSISGTVTADGSPVDDVLVAAFEPTGWFSLQAFTATATDGTYTLGGLQPGDYEVIYVPTESTGLTTIWYAGAVRRAEATTVTVADVDTALVDIDVDLPVAATISGAVTHTAGNPAAEVTVRAYAAADTWLPTASTTTAGDGSYSLRGLPAGDYKLLFVPPATSGLTSQWHAGVSTRAAAITHTVAAGEDLAGIDAALEAGGAISGVVTTTGDQALEGATVAAFRPGGWMPTATASTGPDGTYTLADLTADTYRLRISASGHSTQWWDGAATRSAATDIVVADGAPATGIDARLSPT